MFGQQPVKVKHISARPALLRLEGNLQFIWGHNGSEELLSVIASFVSCASPQRGWPRGHNSATDLAVNDAVLRTRDEHEALDLEEISELGWVELANANGVALFAGPAKDGAEVLNERKICGDPKSSNENAEDICIASALDDSVTPHE